MRPSADGAAREPVVCCVTGSRRFHRAPRRVIVTDTRVRVVDGGHVTADCPRCAAELTEQGPNGLVVELAGTPYRLEVPASEREHAEQLAHALGQDRLVAALRGVTLTGPTRRAFAIEGHPCIAIVVTARRLAVLARHDAHTEVAVNCPRSAVRVRAQETVWPGGDLIFDRVVLDVAGTTLEFDVDGRLHERVVRAVTALGGVSGRPTPTPPPRKANA